VEINRHLTEQELTGLLKAGEVLLPGDEISPDFRAGTKPEEIHRILNYMGREDLEDVKLLLQIFSFLPKFFIHFILWISRFDEKVPSFIGTAFRQIQIGVRGLVYTLYYSDLTDDEKIFKDISWDAKVNIKKEGKSYMETQNVIRSEKMQNAIFKTDLKSIFEVSKSAEENLSKTSIKERIEKIKNLRKRILSEREEILDKIQEEVGKSRSDALMSEIFGALDFLEYLEENAEKAFQIEKVKTPLALMGKKSEIRYEPRGTVLIISPWNYPFYQAIVPIANAYAAGNAVIYKPSEHTPLRGLVENLFSEFEPGAVQVVYGDGKVGSELIDCKPDKIFFTGSVPTGKKIMNQASNHLIPVVLELGGKDPMIVFEDANISRAARGALWGSLTNCGQACTSVERIFIHQSIYNEFKKEITELSENVLFDSTEGTDGDIGRMCIDSQVKLVSEHLIDALEKGATLLTGKDWDKKSKSIPPLLIENVNESMKIYSEETFGPVIMLIPFQTEDEAIKKSNSTEYGLASSVWSADTEKAKRVSSRLKTGNVSINNVMITEGNPHLPFGGVKNSGFGRLKGIEGLREFTYSKSIVVDANSSKTEANWFPYTSEKYNSFSSMMVNLFSHGAISFVKFALSGMKLESLSNKLGKSGRGEKK
jgi:aldehyde dehydrogenase (NAD+)